MTNHPTTLIIAAFATASLAAGCAGNLDVNMPYEQNGSARSTPPSGTPGKADAPTPPPSSPDGGVVSSDSGPVKWDTGAKTDALAAKTDSGTKRADTGAPPSTGTAGAGGKCPCKAGAMCINGTCRAKCSTGGICGVESTCPATQSCVQVLNVAKTFVCIPAATAGGACNASKPCPRGYVCGAVNGAAHRCLPVCKVPLYRCGKSAGICLKTTRANCNFCSTP